MRKSLEIALLEESRTILDWMGNRREWLENQRQLWLYEYVLERVDGKRLHVRKKKSKCKSMLEIVGGVSKEQGELPTLSEKEIAMFKFDAEELKLAKKPLKDVVKEYQMRKKEFEEKDNRSMMRIRDRESLKRPLVNSIYAEAQEEIERKSLEHFLERERISHQRELKRQALLNARNEKVLLKSQEQVEIISDSNTESEEDEEEIYVPIKKMKPRIPESVSTLPVKDLISGKFRPMFNSFPVATSAQHVTTNPANAKLKSNCAKNATPQSARSTFLPLHSSSEMLFAPKTTGATKSENLPPKIDIFPAGSLNVSNLRALNRTDLSHSPTTSSSASEDGADEYKRTFRLRETAYRSRISNTNKNVQYTPKNHATDTVFAAAVPPALRELSTLGNGLELGPSSIDGAGRGVFATKPFPKYSYITDYNGRYISREEAEKKRSKGDHYYIRSVDRYTMIDGIQDAKVGDHLGSLVNDGILPKFNNTKFVRVWDEANCVDHIIVQALRDIKPGEELLCSYGRGYWDMSNEGNNDD